MSTRNLDHMFKPSAVAVIGASDRPHSVGAVVMRNLLAGGFTGPIMPVNPKHLAVAGVMAYPTVKALPVVPELAVICSPPATVPEIVHDLGQRGTRAALVLSAGLDLEKGESGKTLQEAAQAAASPHLLRILGPNTIGLMAPATGLNASFAHEMARPGKVAFVTQSGALSTAVLDYARSNEIGFSYFISLGNCVDVDFGDLLDYLALDPSTGAILLYIEAIREARKFMSAARAAAMNKPVLAVKAGRVPEGAKAALSHTGAMAGADDVYEAALKRAGILRVESIGELFDAVGTLGLAKPIEGDRIVTLTNGGGPGVMATDALVTGGGRLASLSPGTLDKLNQVLPPTWSHGNPVDIIGDAPAQRYVDALKVLLKSSECDAILFIHAPSAIVNSFEIATAMAPVVQASSRTVVSCWLGRNAVANARRVFIDAGIPTYEAPEDAVRGLLQLTRYRESQLIRLETPAAAPAEYVPRLAPARTLIHRAMEAKRFHLGEAEAKEILSEFGIPTVQTRIATSPTEAERLAAQIGCPVALKILSPDVIHKSDVGGVVLDLESPQAVRQAAEAMMKRLERLLPTAGLSGFTVQQMARRPGAHELIVGAATDPSFGPVLLFGQGGTAVEVVRDRAIALPPLNDALARDLIGRTRVAKLLAGYRGHPAADIKALCSVLIQISQLLEALPEVAELDINPLLADENGVLALDARMRLAAPAEPGIGRFAIRPYPHDLEEEITLGTSRIKLRPIRPEDAPAYVRFLEALGPQAEERFEITDRTLPTAAVRHTQIDYSRQMAFVATNAKGAILGVVRTLTDPNNVRASGSMGVLPAARDKGLDVLLINKMAAYCRTQGTAELCGTIRKDNRPAQQMARKAGWELVETSNPSFLEARLNLQQKSVRHVHSGNGHGKRAMDIPRKSSRRSALVSVARGRLRLRETHVRGSTAPQESSEVSHAQARP